MTFAICISRGLVGAAMILLVLACLFDWAFRIVPNVIPLSVAALGAALRLVSGNLAAALLVMVAVLLLAAWCWRRGFLGGADVKLFGAGVLLGPPACAFEFVLMSCLSGGVLALVYLAIGRLAGPPAPPPAPRRFVSRLLRIERRRLRRRGPLPYATAIAAGAILVQVRL